MTDVPNTPSRRLNWLFGPLLCLCLIGFAGKSLAETTQTPRDYVLVHGAWVGEWYWQGLVDSLQAAGHQAIAVSLTGHGARASEGGAHVSIEMHAQDILDVVQRLRLRDVILVGHSYGGRPITAAWDQMRDNVSHVVYVEAVAPTNDNEIAIPQDNMSMRFIMQNNPAWVEDGLIPVPARLRRSYDQVLAPQSMRSVYGAVTLRNGPLPLTPGTYIVAQESLATVFRSYGKRLQSWRGWNLHQISGGHDVMGQGQEDLLNILLSIGD